MSKEDLVYKYSKLLINSEVIELGFKLIRDTFIFTNKMVLNELQLVKLNKNQLHTKVFQDLAFKP